MNSTLSWIVAAALALGVVACGGSADTAKPQASPPKETVFDSTIANKERAKQRAEQAMEQNKQKLEAAMNEAEQPQPAQ